MLCASISSQAFGVTIIDRAIFLPHSAVLPWLPLKVSLVTVTTGGTGPHSTVILSRFPFQTATVPHLLGVAELVQTALLLGTLPGGLPAILATPAISVYTNR